jgi:putative membrane protein (TIGR04086 family)
MKATKKRPSTAKMPTHTANRPNENKSAFALWSKATARGCLIALAATAVLSAVAAGIAYATADPDALVMPLALCVLALCPLIGGLVTYRSRRASPLLCGAFTGLGLLFVYFVFSCLLPDALRGAWPSGIRWGLRGGVMAFSLLGAILGSYAPKKRRKKRR